MLLTYLRISLRLFSIPTLLDHQNFFLIDFWKIIIYKYCNISYHSNELSFDSFSPTNMIFSSILLLYKTAKMIYHCSILPLLNFHSQSTVNRFSSPLLYPNFFLPPKSSPVVNSYSLSHGTSICQNWPILFEIFLPLDCWDNIYSWFFPFSFSSFWALLLGGYFYIFF